MSDFGGSVRGGLEPRDGWSPPGGGSNLSRFWRLGSWRPGAAWRLVGCAGCEALGLLIRHHISDQRLDDIKHHLRRLTLKAPLQLGEFLS